MDTSYVVKSDSMITREIAEKIIEEFEESIRCKKVLVVDKEIELYKNVDGVYVKIF